MSFLYILITILMFGVLIAVHELGHYLTAKLFGIKVNEFAVGMGPAIWKKQRGETLYALRVLPIGGFCGIEGEDGSSDDPRSFPRKPIWQRLTVLAAGALMNLLLGFLIALIIYLLCSFSGKYSVTTNQLAGFMDGFPLQSESGLLPGDRILAVDGLRVNNTRDFSLFMSLSDGQSVDLLIRRDGERIRLEDFPLQLRDFTLEDGSTVRRYGLYFEQEPLTPLRSLREACYDCSYYARVVWVSLKMLVSGGAGVQDLSGPVGIVKAISDAGVSAPSVSAGLMNVFSLIAFVAVNLAVMNLLPIPALDGGRIFFMLIFSLLERLLGRKPDPRIEGGIHAAALLLLMGLMVFVLFHDIFRLF